MKMRGVPSMLALGLALSVVGCGLGKKKKDDDKPLPPPPNGYVADTGFRPATHGFAFKNTGGKYPKTPGIVDTSVMVRMFGKDACVGGNTAKCKMTPAASEWNAMINRAINGGRCEGMAVASLTMFQKIDDPARYGKGATTAHNVNQQAVTPLIAYYWAWQAVDPMTRETVAARRRTTPKDFVDQLVAMMKKKEMATVAFWAPPPQKGGHAVTPYAVEHKGNDVYWVRVYDNNWPDKERYIIVDKKANTWRYELAALNPDQPKTPWHGTASSRSIVALPVATRLKKAVCPFCANSGKKTVMARGTEVMMTDEEGRKVGYDGDKLINEIPDADVIDLAAFTEDAEAPEPIFMVPDNQDYDISLGAATTTKPDGEDDDDVTSVAIFSGGSAVSVGRTKREKGQRDVITLSRDNSDIKFKTGSGRVPRLRVAMDDDKEGTVVGIRNMKGDPDDEVDLKLDRKEGKVHLQGNGKKAESYDLKVKKVRADADDDEIEEKGVKIRNGESHAIDVKTAKKGTKPGIARGKSVPKPKKTKADRAKLDKDKDDKKVVDKNDDKEARAKDAKEKPTAGDKKSVKKDEPRKPPPASQQKKGPPTRGR
jgi:hypothetical protein